jgi:hypothetical protein
MNRFYVSEFDGAFEILDSKVVAPCKCKVVKLGCDRNAVVYTWNKKYARICCQALNNEDLKDVWCT